MIDRRSFLGTLAGGLVAALWQRLLGGQRPSLGDYVRGPGATRGTGGAGGG